MKGPQRAAKSRVHYLFLFCMLIRFHRLLAVIRLMNLHQRCAWNTEDAVDIYSNFDLHFRTGSVCLRSDLLNQEVSWTIPETKTITEREVNPDYCRQQITGMHSNPTQAKQFESTMLYCMLWGITYGMSRKWNYLHQGLQHSEHSLYRLHHQYFLHSEYLSRKLMLSHSFVKMQICDFRSLSLRNL